MPVSRSMHLRCYVKIGVLKNSGNFTEIKLFWSFFFFYKKRLQHRCFSVKFAKFLRTPFLTEHLWWLLLYHCKLHLYRLRILLAIPLDCNIISRLFQPNVIFYYLYRIWTVICKEYILQQR